MQKTNLVPAIEERTVSGSSVSFNSAFALPLKACKVSFSATQAGSGDPSPSNPRAISGVSAIGLNANSTPVSVSLGDTRYGGELDVLTGILTVTDIELNLGQLTWQYVAGCFLARNQSLPMSSNDSASHVDLNVMFDIYKPVSSWNDITINVQDLCGGVYQDQIRIANSNYTDAPTFKTAMKDHYVVYQLATPITIQLSPTQLSSIIGNNTFSTDTGTLEITFADLQERSASGAVASFNTALAMPLASCNIAINAWQEGSGDPSPDNVRPIHGWTASNLTRAGKNLFDYDSITIDRITFIVSSGAITRSGFVYRLPKGEFTFSARGVAQTYVYMNIYASDGSYKENIRLSASNPVWNKKTFNLAEGDYIIVYQAIESVTLDISSNEFMIEAGSEATAYEPYVTPDIYTIQLGQEVYGAEVDVDNSVAHVTHKLDTFDLTDAISSTILDTHTRWQFKLSEKFSNVGTQLCNVAPYRANYSDSSTHFYCMGTDNQRVCVFLPNEITTYSGIQVCYPLATPFDIQLSDIPTLSTIIGNNTIFADTGDVDLTFKDLDIAKRGNFREVFRLPS